MPSGVEVQVLSRAPIKNDGCACTSVIFYLCSKGLGSPRNFADAKFDVEGRDMNEARKSAVGIFSSE